MSTYKIYFSATNKTKNILDILTSKFNNILEFNIADNNIKNIDFNKDDLTFFGVPSFAGRVPVNILNSISTFNGNGSNIVLVVTYGNRAYEDTLIELYDFFIEHNFNILAMMTVITNHSIVGNIAKDRPNNNDVRDILSFGDKILNKLNSNDYRLDVKVPGNRPYKEIKVSKLDIIVNDKCIKCGLCYKLCPTNAISQTNYTINKDRCISCMRCVYNCTSHARYVSKVALDNLMSHLEKVCSEYKENEYYI